MDYKLNPSEWRVLQTLWGHAPQTLMQLVSNLQRSTDWSASTIKTLVSRMTDKGVLRFEGERPRLYYPGIQKEDAAFSETQQTALARLRRQFRTADEQFHRQREALQG